MLPKPPPRLWQRAEKVYHMSMRELLPRLIRALGYSGTAKALRVSVGSVVLWTKTMKLHRITLLVGEDEEIVIRKLGSGQIQQQFEEPERDLEEDSLEG